MFDFGVTVMRMFFLIDNLIKMCQNRNYTFVSQAALSFNEEKYMFAFLLILSSLKQVISW